MNRRTSLITAGAVTATVLAGTTAVAANIGILNSADEGPIGDLSAIADVAVTAPADQAREPQVVDVYIEEPIASQIASTTVPAAAFDTGARDFSVEDAGTVTIATTEAGLRVVAVAANPGWEWSGSEAGPLAVTFTGADATYVFYADVAADGSVTARVEQPIVQTVVVPAAPGTATGYEEGGYEDEDDGEYEYEEDDDDEHEGGDDDD